MKKQIIMIACGVILSATTWAQEYKVSKSSGTLDISEVNHVKIEGTTGNEIIFSSDDKDRDDDGRSKGLRAISSLGIEDNTGLGISVVDKGTTIEVRQLKKMDGPEITIKVPKGVVVSYSHNSPHGDEVQFKNFEGEIEVSTVHSGVRVENSTGPMRIKTIHGDIEVVVTASMKSPISLTSMHGHVDLGMPSATKATLKLGTKHGEIFVDPDFKIEFDRSMSGGLVSYSDNISGKVNGGGVDITLSSQHNSVYLRKK
jgi:hypothetical protein